MISWDISQSSPGHSDSLFDRKSFLPRTIKLYNTSVVQQTDKDVMVNVALLDKLLHNVHMFLLLLIVFSLFVFHMYV